MTISGNGIIGVFNVWVLFICGFTNPYNELELLRSN